LSVEDIERLEAEASTLFDKRDEARKEMDRWQKERDHLNQSVKELQEKARTARDERDRLNGRVAEIKGRLAGLRERLIETREEVGDLDDELEESRRRLRPRRRLQQELWDIEWEVATTPTLEIKDREGDLIDRTGVLRREIDEHRRLDTRDDMYLMSLADSKAISVEIRKHTEERDEIREESQEHHERMLSFYRQADEDRRRANEAHEKFVEALNSMKEANSELDGIMVVLREHRKSLRDADRAVARRRDESLEVRKKELAEDARRKLAAGEKLTLEEMKLIYGEE